MPTRPTRFPRWAFAAPTGAIVEVPSGVAAVGYTPAERPPAQWFNYQFNLLGGWIDYLSGPSLGNWVRWPLSDMLARADSSVRIDADTVTADTAARARFVIAGFTGFAPHIYVSYRGHDWEECTRFAVTPTGTVRGLRFFGRWYLWTAGLYSTPADDGVASSAVAVDGSATWTDSGLTGVAGLSYDPTGNTYLTIHTTGPAWHVSTDGLTWTVPTVTGTPTGTGQDAVWSRTRHVSITSTGQIWSTPNPATAITHLADIGVTGTWRLTAGNGLIAAYQPNVLLMVLWVSSDDGASWTVHTVPAGITNVTGIVFADGQWLVTADDYPYLWASNDLVTWDAVTLPIPQSKAVFPGLQSAVSARGSIVLLADGADAVYQSLRSNDLASGDPTIFGAPVVLSDAAYLRGRVIATTAPTANQVLAWNNGLSEWVPTTIAGVGGSDASSIRTRAVSTTAPADGDVYVWVAGSSDWEPMQTPPAVAASLATTNANVTTAQSTATAAAAAVTALDAAVVHLTGVETAAGAKTWSGNATFTGGSPIISASIGPTSGQQHALQAVASGTLALTTDITGALTDVLANTVNRTYAFGGGAHDFTADANYSPTALFPDSNTSLTCSDVLGDGVNEPFFYVVGKDVLIGGSGGLARQAGGSLRMTMGNTNIGGDGWPVGATTGAAIVVPLYGVGNLVCTFTLKSNFFSVAASQAHVGIWVPNGSVSTATSPRVHVDFSISSSHTQEIVTAYTNAYSSANLTSWESGGVFTRTYQLVCSGLGVAALGSPAGTSTPLSLIHGRHDQNGFALNKLLVFSIGNTSNGNGAYIDISDLTVTGKRALL